jgi:hypothetical protein
MHTIIRASAPAPQILDLLRRALSLVECSFEHLDVHVEDTVGGLILSTLRQLSRINPKLYGCAFMLFVLWQTMFLAALDTDSTHNSVFSRKLTPSSPQRG